MKTDMNISTAAIVVSAKKNITDTFPFASFQTLPIATIKHNELFLAVLSGRGEFVDSATGYSVWRPHLMAFYSVVNGFLDELVAIGNPPLATDPPIGKGISPSDKLEDAYLKARARYCEENDKLLDAVVHREECEDLKANVRQFFYKCSEDVMKLYFEKIFVSK